MKVILDIPEIPTNDHQRWALANGTLYPHGEWKQKSGLYFGYPYCSKCGFAYKHAFNFCPNCGADMKPKEGEASDKTFNNR